jgi:hypothetical protein
LKNDNPDNIQTRAFKFVVDLLLNTRSDKKKFVSKNEVSLHCVIFNFWKTAPVVLLVKSIEINEKSSGVSEKNGYKRKQKFCLVSHEKIEQQERPREFF